MLPYIDAFLHDRQTFEAAILTLGLVLSLVALAWFMVKIDDH
jgi:hypothetical protein